MSEPMLRNVIDQYKDWFFYRTSPGLDSRGRYVGPHMARFEPAPWGMGVMVEEAVMNKLVDPLTFSGSYRCISELLSRWTWKVTVTESGGSPYADFRVSGVTFIPVSGSATLSLKLLVSPSNAGGGQVEIVEYDTNKAFIVASKSAIATIGENKTLTYMVALNANTVYISMRFRGTVSTAIGDTFVISEPQVTATAYPLSFTPTTRSAEQLQIPTYAKPKAGEDATNILLENQANGGEDGTTTGFVAFNATLLSDTAEKWQGSRAIKVTTLGVATNESVRATAPGKAGITYTASARVKVPIGEPMQLLLRRDSTTNLATAFFNGTGDWQEVKVSVLLDADTSNLGLWVRTNDAVAKVVVFWIDALMIEPGTRAGSWVPGGMKRYLDATQGEIGFMVNMTAVVKRNVTGMFPFLFHVPGLMGNGMRLYHTESLANFMIALSKDDGTTSYNSFADNLLPDGWIRVVVRWTATECSISVNGVVVFRLTDLAKLNFSSAFAQYLHAGNISTMSAGRCANTTFADFYFRSEPRTDIEIAVNPLGAYQWDSKTTLKPVFEPFAQRMAMVTSS